VRKAGEFVRAQVGDTPVATCLGIEVAPEFEQLRERLRMPALCSLSNCVRLRIPALRSLSNCVRGYAYQRCV